MANPAIKFKRVATFTKTGLEKGTIYFEHSTGNIYIATGADTYDVYGLGLKEASWNGQVLTLKQSGASDIVLDFSNVASKNALDTVSADLTKLAGRVTTNETDIANLKTADTTLQSNINTVAGNLATEVQDRKDAVAGVQGNLDTLSATVTALDGTVAANKSAIEKTVADNKAAIEKTVGELTTTVTNNKTAADATQTELTNYKSSNDAALGVIRDDISELETAVNNAQKAATTTLTEADPAFGIKVAKTTETDGHLNYTITGVDLAKGSDLSALDARVGANEDAIEVINGTGDGSIKKAVADLKKEILTGDATGEINTAYDTIKEVSDWIVKHQGTDYANLVSRMGTAEAEIDGLQEKVDVESVSGAISGAIGALDAEKTSTDGKNVQVKVTEANGVITAVNITTDNTVNKDTYATDKSGLEASIATAKKAGDDAQADLNTFKNTVSSTYATKTTVNGIDTRLTTAEGDIDELEAFQTTASADIAQLKTDVVAAKKAGDDAQADVDALEKVVAGLNIDLGKNYATKAELATTNGNVATNTAAIATLNGDVNTTGSVAKAIADALVWADFD